MTFKKSSIIAAALGVAAVGAQAQTAEQLKDALAQAQAAAARAQAAAQQAQAALEQALAAAEQAKRQPQSCVERDARSARIRVGIGRIDDDYVAGPNAGEQADFVQLFVQLDVVLFLEIAVAEQLVIFALAHRHGIQAPD